MTEASTGSRRLGASGREDARVAGRDQAGDRGEEASKSSHEEASCRGAQSLAEVRPFRPLLVEATRLDNSEARTESLLVRSRGGTRHDPLLATARGRIRRAAAGVHR